MATTNTNTLIEKIFEVYDRRGAEKYADEEVTQLQHATQCGQLARAAGEDSSIVVAALLHDVGHLLADSDLPESCNEDLDDAHEQIGYDFLLNGFGEKVAEIVRLHVDAKRYLCTKEEGYLQQLSPTSLKSFEDQGGLMAENEIEAFESGQWYNEAIRLRRWDDQAKDANLPLAEVRDFLPEIYAAIAEHRNENS